MKKLGNNFVGFWEELKIRNNSSEIFRPLAWLEVAIDKRKLVEKGHLPCSLSRIPTSNVNPAAARIGCSY
jgi:hypothetical protein